MSEAIIEALRNRAKRFFSLDTPANPDLGEVAIDVAAGFVPGVGTALSARDFERSRREGDKLGMALAGAGMVPVAGGGVRALTKALRKAPRDEALEVARQNAVKMLGLPENNTAMDRARALGFNVEAFHGTNKAERNAGVSNNLGNSTSGISGGDDLLRDRSESSAIRSLLPGGTWFHKDPTQAFASGEGAYVIPSLVRLDNPIKRNSYFGMEDFSDPSRFKYFDKDKKKFVTPDGVVGDNGVVVAFNPNQVRSRFAAFDPARINENDLLGRADPRLLGLIAAGTATGATVAALRNKKEDEKRKNDKRSDD